MTTSGEHGNAGRKPASRQAPGVTGGPVSDPPGAAGSSPPDPQPGQQTREHEDVQALQQEIAQTRERLGDTVEQLAAKADVKAQAKAKAGDVAEQAKAKAAQARDAASSGSARIRSQLVVAASGAQQKVATLTGTGQSALRASTTRVRQATPEQLRHTTAKAASAAKKYSVPLAIAAVAFIAACLAIWSRRRR